MTLRLLMLGFLLVGCKEKPAATVDAAAAVPVADARPSMAQSATPDASTKPGPPDAGPPDARPPGTPDAAPPPPRPTGKSVGVPACDEYLDKMARCIAKLSPESAQPLSEAMEDSRQAWRQTASSNEGRAALVDACKSALQAAKSAAEAMGCSW